MRAISFIEGIYFYLFIKEKNHLTHCYMKTVIKELFC